MSTIFSQRSPTQFFITHTRSFPLREMCSTIDRETLLPHGPSTSQTEAFVSFTGMPFSPPVTTSTEDLVTLYCPNCSQTNQVPWINHNGTGYAQRSFETECLRRECRMKFDREVRSMVHPLTLINTIPEFMCKKILRGLGEMCRRS